MLIQELLILLCQKVEVRIIQRLLLLLILCYIGWYIELWFWSPNWIIMLCCSFLTFETITALTFTLIVVVTYFIHLLEPFWPFLKAPKAPHLFRSSCLSSLWCTSFILILINMVITKKHAIKVRPFPFQLSIRPVILFKCPSIASIRSELLKERKFFIFLCTFFVTFLWLYFLSPELIIICGLLWTNRYPSICCNLRLVVVWTSVTHVYFKSTLQFQREICSWIPWNFDFINLKNFCFCGFL